MISFLSSPLFYFFVTVGIYFLFALLQKKTHSPLLNPLLWTIVFVIGYILLVVLMDKHELNPELIEAEVSNYEGAVNIFDILLAPVTVALALPLYANRHVLKENWLAIIVASVVGVGTSIGSVILLGYLLGLDNSIVMALYPRGVTTAIAREISVMLGVGQYASITVTVVVITGIVGAILGLALGSASHAIGTSKAFDYSQKAGAIASVSIITNGFLTVVVALIVSLCMR